MLAPARKYEVNINTVILLAGFAAMAIGWGMTWQSARGDIEALKDWRTEATVALKQIDGLTFRTAALEASNASFTRGMSEMQAAMSRQSGDIQVVKEILQRIERQSSPASFSPVADAQ
jgi:Tfp pilus assembly protein PilO